MLVIDRFEGDWAVIEFGDKTFDIPRSQEEDEDDEKPERAPRKIRLNS